MRFFGWCRKYGIRVNLDLHAMPGSQNGAKAENSEGSHQLTLYAGYNHSGKQGNVNFLRGPMGLANAQRALDYIRTYTQFISQVSAGRCSERIPEH